MPQLLEWGQAANPKHGQTLNVLHHNVVVIVQMGRECLANYVLMVTEHAAESCVLDLVLPMAMEVERVCRVAATLAAVPFFNTAGFALNNKRSAMGLTHVIILISCKLKPPAINADT